MKCGLWVVFLINNSLCLLNFLFKYFACLKIYATFIIVVAGIVGGVVVVALRSLLQRVCNTDSSPKLALAFLFVLKVLLLLNLWLFVACSDALLSLPSLFCDLRADRCVHISLEKVFTPPKLWREEERGNPAHMWQSCIDSLIDCHTAKTRGKNDLPSSISLCLHNLVHFVH